MSERDGMELLRQLNEAPEEFFDKGLSFDLLNCYFRGLPISTLDELLTHKNPFVKKSAIWIASELGELVVPYVDSIVALLDEDDAYIRYYAVEILFGFSCLGMKGLFHYVIQALDWEKSSLVMSLISNASSEQLLEAFEHPTIAKISNHRVGLGLLLDGWNSDSKDINAEILYGKNLLLSQYAAILAKKKYCNGVNVNVNVAKVRSRVVTDFLEYHGL